VDATKAMSAMLPMLRGPRRCPRPARRTEDVSPASSVFRCSRVDFPWTLEGWLRDVFAQERSPRMMLHTARPTAIIQKVEYARKTCA